MVIELQRCPTYELRQRLSFVHLVTKNANMKKILRVVLVLVTLVVATAIVLFDSVVGKIVSENNGKMIVARVSGKDAPYCPPEGCTKLFIYKQLILELFEDKEERKARQKEGT